MIALFIALVLHTHVSTGGWRGVIVQTSPTTCVGWDASEGGIFGTPFGSGGNCS